MTLMPENLSFEAFVWKMVPLVSFHLAKLVTVVLRR